jgi:polar amino acid transport system substrate-binding protein
VLLVGGLLAGAVVRASVAPAAAQGEPLVICSDIAFPPMESMQNGQPVGADIDIGTEIGKRLNREAQFVNVGFDGIIAALLANKCDIIMSGMNDTPERAKQVDFVDYLNVGQSLVVPKGNPLGITSLETICGHDAGAQVGTTNIDALNAANEACKAAGKLEINVSGYKTDSDAMLALKADRIDVYETDSSVAAYYISQDPGAFEFGGKAINPIPVGIAVRKDNTELRDQVQAAVDAMYADGTMMKILETWKLQDFVLPKYASATPVATPAA